VLSIDEIRDPKQSFRFTESNLQQAEQHLADPRWHTERHMSVLDESDTLVGDLVELQDMIDLLLKRVDTLENTVSKLNSLINWDNIWDPVPEDLNVIKGF
jgi:hypothetical protein